MCKLGVQHSQWQLEAAHDTQKKREYARKDLCKRASQPLRSYSVSSIYCGAFLVKAQKLPKDLEIPMNSKHAEFFPNQ